MKTRQVDYSQVETYTTFRTLEAGHVLHNAQDRQFGSLAEVDLLADVEKCNLLRRGDKNRTVGVRRGNEARFDQQADHSQVLVTSARRRVDYQVIQRCAGDFVARATCPIHVFQKLFDDSVFSRSAPNYSVAGVR